MTLDEAIKKEEEIAIQQIEKANAIDNIPLFGMSENDIEEIKECYKCSKEHEQLAEWLKELKQLREQTRWIPVSERMPEENGEYFVTVKRGYVMIAIWVGTAEFWNEVTAWMSKPEKYEASPKGRK